MDLSRPLLILALISSICKGQRENNCYVGPKDLYVEVGSDVEIMCQTSCANGKTYWTLDTRPVDKSLSKNINASHTVLLLRGFTQRSGTVQCHNAVTEHAVGGTIITTYSKPSKVSCILQCDPQNLPYLFTCEWEHQNYSSLEVIYTVFSSKGKINIVLRQFTVIISHNIRTSVSTCSSYSSKRNLCSSRNTTCTSNYYDIMKIITFVSSCNVTVRAKSAMWEVYSDNYEFTPSKISKITHPLIDVTIVSDHILVSWNLTSSLTNTQYQCQVKYNKVLSKEAPEVLNKTLRNSLEKRETVIEDVESCTNYIFAVRCALVEAPWSDWSQAKTVLTKLKRSDYKPRLWRKISDGQNNAVRKVQAMWRDTPSTCQGTFTFTIKQASFKEQMTGANYTLCDHSVCDVSQAEHRLFLTVFHDESLFVEDSVYIPANREDLPQVTDIQISTHEGIILVSWKAPAQRVSGYIIDYTHNGNQYNWMETKDTNASLSGLLDTTQYIITVTPLFGDKTGRGTQALQICSSKKDPGNVIISKVQPDDKNALVSWTLESQEACSGVVVNYTVFYRELNGPQFNVSVDGTTQNISLKHLNPDTMYKFYVKATALTGTTQSIERFFSTTRFHPGLDTVLSICGSILIVLVLSIGLFCAIQCKKFWEKPVPNPGDSSVALWLSATQDKETCPFQAFHNPTESFCNNVFTEEALRTSTSSLAASYIENPASNPEIVPAPDQQSEERVERVKMEHSSSPEESMKLLSLENCLSSPYQSQSPVETPAQRTSRQCKRTAAKQQETNPEPMIVYVTLDMFEQSQRR